MQTLVTAERVTKGRSRITLAESDARLDPDTVLQFRSASIAGTFGRVTGLGPGPRDYVMHWITGPPVEAGAPGRVVDPRRP